jgi:hypothetical protein
VVVVAMMLVLVVVVARMVLVGTRSVKPDIRVTLLSAT